MGTRGRRTGRARPRGRAGSALVLVPAAALVAGSLTVGVGTALAGPPQPLVVDSIGGGTGGGCTDSDPLTNCTLAEAVNAVNASTSGNYLITFANNIDFGSG